MFLDSISKKYRYRYLFSSDFNNLCLALNFLPEDIDEIKQKTYNLDKESDIEKSIALIIYDRIKKILKRKHMINLVITGDYLIIKGLPRLNSFIRFI